MSCELAPALYQNFLRHKRGVLPLLPAYSNFCFFAQKVCQDVEPASQSFAIEGGVSRRNGQNEGSVLICQWGLVDYSSLPN